MTRIISDKSKFTLKYKSITEDRDGIPSICDVANCCVWRILKNIKNIIYLKVVHKWRHGLGVQGYFNNINNSLLIKHTQLRDVIYGRSLRLIALRVKWINVINFCSYAFLVRNGKWQINAVQLRPGVDFTNILWAAFSRKDPKSAKR